MEKNIRDYLHLYLGCDVEHDTGKWRGCLSSIGHHTANIFCDYLKRNEGHKIPEGREWGYFDILLERLKPMLRPLSDMTEEEAADVYTIERDRILHPPTDDHDISRRTDFGWVVTRLDHTNIGLLIRFDGVCYKVIDEGKKPTIEPAMNQPLIFQYMLSKHFDLFGLIKSGLAIDKTNQSIK